VGKSRCLLRLGHRQQRVYAVTAAVSGGTVDIYVADGLDSRA
jgi:hypothetical protein